MLYDPLGHYTLLGLDSSADEKVLKISYREKAKLWHPDHNKAENALEEFQKLSIAYDVLKDCKTRTVYDLLSLAYNKAEFPDMKSLKTYKSVTGEETAFLRVFKLFRIVPNLKNPACQEENLIGTYQDALIFIKEITKHNWLKGWWTPKSIMLNLKALKNNIKNINSNSVDNFKLLIHNAAAYYHEGKENLAYLSAVQAFDYGSSNTKAGIQNFLSKLTASNQPIPKWDFEALQKTQRKYPFFAIGTLALLGLFLAAPIFLKMLPESSPASISYYQEVRFNSGTETVDDIVVAKIFNIPADTSDTKMLYYTTATINVMHGPSEEFDVITKMRLRQTVRVTGYTPDKQWYRVMLDNGEMGFIKEQYLKQGIGRDIPENSKIFQNIAL